MKLFEKTYDGESLYDLSRDISEVFDSDSNAAAALISQDEHGLQQGTFKVTVEWEPLND